MSNISNNKVKTLGLHHAWTAEYPNYIVGDLTTENGILYICNANHIPTEGDSLTGSPSQPSQANWDEQSSSTTTVHGYIEETNATTFTQDLSAGDFFDYTLAGDVNMVNPLNMVDGQTGTLCLRQDGVGARTVTWGNAFVFPGDSQPVLTTGPDSKDIFDYYVIKDEIILAYTLSIPASVLYFTANFEVNASASIFATVDFEWSDDGGTTWNAEVATTWTTPNAGVYSIRSLNTGLFQFGDAVVSEGAKFINDITCTGPIDNAYAMFMGCSNVDNINVMGLMTKDVTDFERMFFGCSKLTSIDLSNLDTSDATTLRSMLYNCASVTSYNLPLDTAKVTDMSYVFEGNTVIATLDLSTWNTRNVLDTVHMFDEVNNLVTLTLNPDFILSKVVDIASMFAGCESIINLDLSIFNGAKIENMASFVTRCINLETLDLTSLDLSGCESFRASFSDCNKLTCITNIDTTGVTVSNGKDLVFDNTPLLTAPDAAAQTDLLDTDGANWVNPSSCP